MNLQLSYLYIYKNALENFAMKKILYIVLPVAISLAGCSAMIQTTASSPPQPQPVYTDNFDNTNYQTDQVFYDELSPYGTWVNYPDYGYVWVPDAGPDFRPYATNGYWVYSDYGWTWVSNYIWGWAPFHYGRWFYDDYYGWAWVPGQEWAPAWVTWGSYNDNFCWAPISPRVNMTVVSSGQWMPPANSWNVVSGRHMTQVNVNNYIQHNTTIVNNITVINNVNNYNDNGGRPGNNNGNHHRVTYNRGPQVGVVESVAHTNIQPVRVTNNTRPGAQVLSNNQLSVFRPAIQQNPSQGNNNKPAPRKVEPFKPGSGFNRPNVNQDQKPNNPEQNPRSNRNNGNQNPQVDPNQKPNNPQQDPRSNRNNGNQNPNNPQQDPRFNRNNGNQNPQVDPNQKPNNPQQDPRSNRNNGNQNPQVDPNQNPNNPQQDPRFNRNNGNQNSQVDPNQKPNNPQQDPRSNRNNGNQNPQVDPNQKPNNPQQDPRFNRNNGNQNPQVDPNQKLNNPPVQNPNLRPANQNAIPGLNPNAPKNRQRQNNTKPDTSKRARPPQTKS